MDTATEAKLIRELAVATRGQTLIICSHRVQFLSLVDRLLVIDGGRLIAQGPRDEILKALQTPKPSITAFKADEAAAIDPDTLASEAAHGRA